MDLQRINKEKLKNIFLLALGLSLILFGINNYYSKRVLTFDYPQPKYEAHKQNIYVKQVGIENLGIDLPVEEAEIIDGVWQISESGASHLSTSGSPTENDNIVIYAHNKKYLFGALPFVKTGDIVTVTTSDATTYQYKVKQIFTVSPDNIEPVLPTDKEVLTLYTCTGLLDSKRLIVKALPV